MTSTSVGSAPTLPVERRRFAEQRPAAPGALDVEMLVEMASGLAAVTEPWTVPAGRSATQRSYECILATASYEVWVIFWPTGGSLDMHDHGGSAGAFAVVSGHLDEAHIEHGLVVERRLDAGDSVGFSERHVHAVANRAAQPATSVHVYSPPLGPMGFYERDTDGRLVEIAR
jgi:hypothetical protein